ncbi:hypothetical protein ACJMK2_027763 [Sinanodonta woodiana]|uniref:Uncharacterized protein n=1 Tax=Sinanodonta woodiana TaxID=1069815 RepID=A0ABD3X6E8_SINWO
MDGVQVTNVSTVLTDIQTAINPTAAVLVEAELNVVVSLLDKLVSIKNSTGANVSEFTVNMTIYLTIILGFKILKHKCMSVKDSHSKQLCSCINKLVNVKQRDVGEAATRLKIIAPICMQVE